MTAAYRREPATGVSAIAFGLDDESRRIAPTADEWAEILELGWTQERVEALWGPMPPDVCRESSNRRSAQAT
jgi:hypothetical protein